MRWIKKKKSSPHIPVDGETRVIQKFLLFPKRIKISEICENIEYECRWLEKVKIKQQYEKPEIHFCGGYYCCTGGKWRDITFID